MKPYIFTYSQLCPEWHAQNILNDSRAVNTWVKPFPNAAIVLSDLSVKDLGAVLRARLGSTWFVISEIDSGTIDGLLPGDLWDFISSANSGSQRGLLQYPLSPPGPLTASAQGS